MKQSIEALKPAQGKKIKNSWRNKKNCSNYIWAYLMVAPTIIGLMILNIWPVIRTAYLSFTETASFGSNKWIGLENYKTLFRDSIIWKATWHTFQFTILVVPLGIFLSLVIAALLNAKIKGTTIYRTIYFLPVVVAPAAIAIVWKWLFNADFGLINHMLSAVGLKGPNWLTNSKWAMFSLSIVGIWSTLGYNMIILLAGLQGIPRSYYEAAEIDGAGSIRQFFNITIPLISPTLFFVTITGLMGAIQQFDLVYMMIGPGNPAIESTQTLLYLFYRSGFVVNDKGFASAIVMWAFLLILIITFIQFILQKKWVFYE